MAFRAPSSLEQSVPLVGQGALTTCPADWPICPLSPCSLLPADWQQAKPELAGSCLKDVREERRKAYHAAASKDPELKLACGCFWVSDQPASARPFEEPSKNCSVMSVW